ncbi:hypothetical protein E1301_Tti016857 [Triplophysa tibetana]|uniref:Uncharacterized protein n=1 Tax=Triplophysa tibetana TaxID=1572043 RepID=A0A5A9N7S8_9TELE|nr:hypothetical protein E1301_Tti016857 [Triplophysa tibetana]
MACHTPVSVSPIGVGSVTHTDLIYIRDCAFLNVMRDNNVMRSVFPPQLYVQKIGELRDTPKFLLWKMSLSITHLGVCGCFCSGFGGSVGAGLITLDKHTALFYASLRIMINDAPTEASNSVDRHTGFALLYELMNIRTFKHLPKFNLHRRSKHLPKSLRKIWKLIGETTHLRVSGGFCSGLGDCVAVGLITLVRSEMS